MNNWIAMATLCYKIIYESLKGKSGLGAWDDILQGHHEKLSHHL